jgi:glycosyltransferase involved in cell wall biosynthesis
MKIAYVCHENAADPAVQSGRTATHLEEFERRGLEVDRLFPLHVPHTGIDLAKKAGYRLMGKYHRRDRDETYLAALADEFERRAAGREYDVIFCPGTEVITKLRTHTPIAFCTDATFANLVDYYWDFTGLSAEYLRNGHAQERAALARADLAFYPSEWAARSAVNDYGFDPARIRVVPFGANHGRHNERASVLRWIAARPTDHLRLLFVGRHWDRKGGELVVATALCLIAHGHPVILDVVGCDVPSQHQDVPWIRRHGLLNQRDPAGVAQLHRLFAEAHFLMVPSRAEAFGIVFAEANAFGVPAIATDTGGIAGAIRHGQNGLLLPLSATPADFADAIVATFHDPGHYQALCRRSFDEFDERLNWRAFTDKFIETVGEYLAEPRPAVTETINPAA